MRTPKFRNRLKIFGLACMFCLSLFSFAYINGVVPELLPTENIFTQEVEMTTEDVMPDVKIIKRLMEKTLEFMTSARAF